MPSTRHRHQAPQHCFSFKNSPVLLVTVSQSNCTQISVVKHSHSPASSCIWKISKCFSFVFFFFFPPDIAKLSDRHKPHTLAKLPPKAVCEAAVPFPGPYAHTVKEEFCKQHVYLLMSQAAVHQPVSFCIQSKSDLSGFVSGQIYPKHLERCD